MWLACTWDHSEFEGSTRVPISAKGGKFSPKRTIHHLTYISAFDRVLLLSFANTSFGVNSTVALGYHGNPST